MFPKKKFFYHLPSIAGMASLNLYPDADAYLLMGSYSNIGDGSLWHGPYFEFVKSLMKKQKPILGICFGHQVLAHLAGAEVAARQGDSLKGVFELEFLSRPDKFKKKKKYQVVKSHGYEVKNLPEGFDLLAQSESCQIEALIHQKNPWMSLQCHPEASWRFVENNVHPEPLNKDEFLPAQQDGKLLISSFFKWAKNRTLNLE